MTNKEKNLPLPADWSVFKARGEYSPEEIRCITELFADDPRLPELGVGFWIHIYRAHKKKRRKSPEVPTGQATRTKARPRRS